MSHLNLGPLIPTVTPSLKAAGDALIFGICADDLNKLLKTDLSPAAWAAIGGGAALLVSILGNPSNPGNPLKWSEVIGILISGVPFAAVFSNPQTRGARKIATFIWVAWLTTSALRTTSGNGGGSGQSNPSYF
jgi:hypothetical protein